MENCGLGTEFGLVFSGSIINAIIRVSNGKMIAKMVNPNVSSVDAISGVLAGKVPVDTDRHSLREERLSKYETDD